MEDINGRRPPPEQSLQWAFGLEVGKNIGFHLMLVYVLLQEIAILQRLTVPLSAFYKGVYGVPGCLTQSVCFIETHPCVEGQKCNVTFLKFLIQ